MGRRSNATWAVYRSLGLADEPYLLMGRCPLPGRTGFPAGEHGP